MGAAVDQAHMARALELARRGLYTTDPNPRVGCVIVRDGEVIGEGWHEFAGGPHAEVHALRQAGARAAGATAYVTLEPCNHQGRTPPCSDALIAAGIARVVAAMTDPDPRTAGAGLERLRVAGLEVECGVLESAAIALNPGFVCRHRLGRPLVRCKLGMTLDGRTATASGESRWITSPEARHDVQRLRARSSAIMCGIGTVLADDPALTVRAGERSGPDDDALAAAAAIRQPMRVIVDSHGRTPADARLLKVSGRVLIASLNGSEASADGRSASAIERLCLPADASGRVDLQALLHALAERHINELLLEAGPTLSGAMLSAGLVDELVIYMAPRLLGDRARGLFTLPWLDRLDQAVGIEISDMRAVGSDWRITARLTQKPRGS